MFEKYNPFCRQIANTVLHLHRAARTPPWGFFAELFSSVSLAFLTTAKCYVSMATSELFLSRSLRKQNSEGLDQT